MKELFTQLGSPLRLSPLMIIVSISLVIILIGGGTWLIASRQSASQQSISAPLQKATSTHVSPLLFGSNLALANGQNQVFTSVATRTLLQQMHIGILRLPIQKTATTADMGQAAQFIKTLGVIPLIVLPDMTNPHALQDDTTLIYTMNATFGSTTVYYEYGNEDDLLGVSADQYVNSWNSTIPQLKQLAPHGQFLGPVSFQYNPKTLTTFLQRAKPLPGAVSWHEYTCDRTQSNDVCMEHISDWTNHIVQARAIMTATLHQVLPIMITEWNYAANALTNDGKSNNSTFMKNWTKQAIETLAMNGVFASMQYACTMAPTALISNNNQLTAQGSAFQQAYEQFIGSPAQANTDTTATPQSSLSPTTISTADLATETETAQSTKAAASITQQTVKLQPTATPIPTPVPQPTATATPAQSHQTIADDLNDWSNTYNHSSGLSFDTNNSQYMGGDTSLVVRLNSSTHEYVVWKLQNMTSFHAVTRFWPTEAVSDYSVYTSSNGSSWTAVSPSIKQKNENWLRYDYSLTGLSHVNYIKMVWNNTKGNSWSPQLSSVTLSS